MAIENMPSENPRTEIAYLRGLGLGAGERLNEHIIGAGWPGRGERHERLSEAVSTIGPLANRPWRSRRAVWRPRVLPAERGRT